MSIVIELTPDLEADLVKQAARSGVPLGHYVRMVLERHIQPGTSGSAAMTPSARVRAFEDWVAKFPYRRAEPLPDEAIARDSFYSRDDD